MTNIDLSQVPGRIDPDATPAQPAPPTPFGNVTRDGKADGSALDWANTLLNSGVDRAKVEAALTADGYRFVEDARNPAEQKFDTLFGAPPNASDYRIDWFGRLPANATPETVAEVNSTAGEWLHALAIPKEIGESLAEISIDLARQNAGRSAGDLEAWKEQQDAALLKWAGSQEAAGNARRVVDEMLKVSPNAFSNELKAHHVFDSAQVIALLALQGKRVVVRSSLRT